VLTALFRSVRPLGLVAVAVATLALGGCYDIEGELRFNADASGDAKLRIGLDRETDDVLAFVQTLARYSDDPKAAALSTGVCSQALLVKAPLDVKRNVRIQRYSEDERLFCEAAIRLPQIDPKVTNPDGYGVFSFTRSGPRRWQIELDFNRMPDLTPFMMMGMMAQLQKNPQFGDRIRGAEMIEIIEAAKKAYVAVTAIAMRGRHVQFTVRAPKIVSSVGAISDDGRAAVFRFSYADLARMMVDPSARAGKRYAVEVEY
jgi:hypothetical protein